MIMIMIMTMIIIMITMMMIIIFFLCPNQMNANQGIIPVVLFVLTFTGEGGKCKKA